MRESDSSRILVASDRALLASFEGSVQAALHSGVNRLTANLLARRDPRITNVHPTYASVLVAFDPVTSSPYDIRALLAECMSDDALTAGTATTSARAVEIPVCYGGEFGPDLDTVAALHDLEPGEVVRLHSESEYVVCFL